MQSAAYYPYGGQLHSGKLEQPNFALVRMLCELALNFKSDLKN